MTTDSAASGNLFRDINADDEAPEVTEMESLCVACEEQGVTRLFPTRIPFFREVIVSSFNCEHCGAHNSELQPASSIQEKGIKVSVRISKPQELNRQVVQTNNATVSIPELDFETPPNAGVLTTVEGLIDRAVEGLKQDQVLRRIQHPDLAEQLDKFVARLEDLKTCNTPFHLVIDDPSGNSFVENPNAPNTDPEMKVVHFTRTKEQNESLGLQGEDQAPAGSEFNAQEEVMSFPTNCPNCRAPCVTNMKMVDIPHFKEIVIMATVCDACNYRDNEVKGGSGIDPTGCKITLRLTDVSDLSRDVLKGDLGLVSIPELDFSTGMTSMPSKFTTVEGLLDAICTQIKRLNSFFGGDSAQSQKEKLEKIQTFCKRIEKIMSGETMDVHIVLDDPTGNSYIQNLYAPDPDPEMTIERYERTEEQNEELGLNDMKTENY